MANWHAVCGNESGEKTSSLIVTEKMLNVEERTVYWPPNNRDAKNKLTSLEPSDPETWQRASFYKKIGLVQDELADALQLMEKHAPGILNTSSDDSDDSDHSDDVVIAEPSKRDSKRKWNCRSSSSSGEEDEESNKRSKKDKTFPKKKQRSESRIKLVQTPSTNMLDIAMSDDENSLATPEKNRSTTVRSFMELILENNHSAASGASPDAPPPEEPSVMFSSLLSSPRINPTPTSVKLTEESTYVTYEDMMIFMDTLLIKQQKLFEAKFKKCSEIQEKMMTQIKNLGVILQNIFSKDDVPAKTEDLWDPVIQMKLESFFPITSMEEFTVFDNEIRNKRVSYPHIKWHLKTHSAKNGHDLVADLMKKILAPELAVLFSGQGRGPRRKHDFSSTATSNLILGLVHRLDKDYTRNQLKARTSLWLKQQRLNVARKNKKDENRQNSSRVTKDIYSDSNSEDEI